MTTEYAKQIEILNEVWIERIPELEDLFDMFDGIKYKLSDIANIILKNESKINIVKNNSMNYSGNGSLLNSLNIDLYFFVALLGKFTYLWVLSL